MKKTLFLSYDGMTDPLGQSQVLPYLKGLSNKGYHVHLISFEKADRYKTFKADIELYCKNTGISWYPEIYTKRPPVLSTLLDIRKMNRTTKKLHQVHHFSLIHCRSYISGLIGLGFKRKHHVPFIFDMRGFWADERVDGKIWNLKNPLFKWIYRFFKKKEKQFFSESAKIISLTHAAKKIILSWNLKDVEPGKIQVIPCCVDLDLFNPEKIKEKDKSDLRNQLHLKDKQILGYVGSIGTWYMLPEMLETFKKLNNQKTDLHFLFITKEPGSLIYEQANKLEIDSSKITVLSAKHNEIPLYISLFDVSIFYILPTFSKQASSPTKQGELMSMGIPIICNQGVGDTDYVIHKFNSGVCYELPLKEEISFDSLLNLKKSDITHGAHTFYSLKGGVECYYNCYNELI